MKTKEVWFVTGASRGLGLTLVRKLLANGYRVAATSRSKDELISAVAHPDDNFLPLQVNLLDEEGIGLAVESAVQKFGSLDVVVNNAGFGIVGGIEELSDREVRQNFDINVFGSLNIIRKVLPVMRQQKSGHIFNIASIGGFTGRFGGFGIYCATKFAVHGFSESLSDEIKEFGIRVTIVSPGYFRTNFLDSSLATPENPIKEYSQVRETQEVHQNALNGNQSGDPEKAADVMITVAEQENPPLHLFLGQDAYDLAAEKIREVQNDLDALRSIATATSFQ